MKIAIVTDAWLPQINGVVTTYLKTVQELRRRGLQVVLITPNQFRTVPCPTYPEIPLSLVRPATIREILKKTGAHAVHLATEGPLGWAARRACLYDGFAFTTSYHTRFPEYIRLRVPLPLRLSYSVMRSFHGRGARMMVSSEPLREELEKKGFKNVCLWSRGVDTELFRPLPGARRESAEPVYTYLGRVAPEKNVEAFLKLDLDGRKMVIGDGPALADLRQRYPDVRFTGYKRGRELADLLAGSSVFVFPSRTDTLGVVQLEAMACGVPVAAYPVIGPGSLIVNGRNGWMDEDLAEAVRRCAAIDADDCRDYALGYTWEACSAQFLDNLAVHPYPYPNGDLLLEAAA